MGKGRLLPSLPKDQFPALLKKLTNELSTKGVNMVAGFKKSDFLTDCLRICLFVCGISLTSGQLVSELFPDCTRSCFSQVVLRRRGGDRIYEMRCLFVAVGPNARFIVLPHWDNMS